MDGKGYTLQAVLKDADGREIVNMVGNVEDILDLEHKAARMNEWYPQRGPRKMGRMSAVIKSPQRWTAETPYLYKLELRLQNVNGQTIEIWGDPFAMGESLDDFQGDNEFNFQGNCGLVTIANMLTMAGIECDENTITEIAINNGLCEYNVFGPPEETEGLIRNSAVNCLPCSGWKMKLWKPEVRQAAWKRSPPMWRREDW